MANSTVTRCAGRITVDEYVSIAVIAVVPPPAEETEVRASPDEEEPSTRGVGGATDTDGADADEEDNK